MNATSLCEGTITRMRKTVLSTEKSVIGGGCQGGIFRQIRRFLSFFRQIRRLFSVFSSKSANFGVFSSFCVFYGSGVSLGKLHGEVL